MVNIYRARLICVMAILERAVSVTSANTDYCADRFKCGGKKHFACTHKVRTSGKLQTTDIEGNVVGTECSGMETYLRPEQRSEFLKQVNDFRNTVAEKGGSDIHELTWDYELEEFAKILGTNLGEGEIGNVLSWVRLCAMTESGTTTAVFNVDRTEKDPDEITVNWLLQKPGQDIIDKFPGDINPNDTTPAALVASWAALAWATATKLGCAYVRGDCDPPFPDIGSEVSIAVCFVGPGSNTAGQKVYKRGAPCSDCPPSTQCHPSTPWPMLCAPSYYPRRAKNSGMVFSAHHRTLSISIAVFILSSKSCLE